MITLDNDLRALHRQALQRHARQRVDHLDELRAAQNAAARGLKQRDIAELLATSQPKVHRLLKSLERRSWDMEQGPEEIILRAFAYDTSREALVSKLRAFPYTFGEVAPYPHEGRIPGTWDEVIAALAQGMLSDREFADVRAAIGR